MNKNPNPSTRKRLTGGVLAVILLALCLVVTTYALVYYSVEVKDNYFNTGVVSINLNDGKAIIGENAPDYNGKGVSQLFEPGMTVKRNFFIQNESTEAVYYRLYFKDVKGALAKVLLVSVRDKNTGELLYSGTPAELMLTDENNIAAANDQLRVGQRRDLTMYFYFPQNAGNVAQNCTLEFTLCAQATQVRNNPDKTF